jgi:hypothetical protein
MDVCRCISKLEHEIKIERRKQQEKYFASHLNFIYLLPFKRTTL